MDKKIIRTICVFSDDPSQNDLDKLKRLSDRFAQKEYIVQTHRLCSPVSNKVFDMDYNSDGSIMFSLGSLQHENASNILDQFLSSKNVSFNIDLTKIDLKSEHTSILTNIIYSNPRKTFNFTYTFNNSHSSPYFPSATYKQNGFSIGLQPTNLSSECKTIQEWLEKMFLVWQEVENLAVKEDDFLGIDTSVAPLFCGNSSFIHFIKQLGFEFDNSVTTNIYLTITEFLKKSAIRPIGLCGLMFPCLEDFDLAEEYENGSFYIERNVFLSLHSGLGIDTYPIGINEDPKRVLEILQLIQGLSNKYLKPLSVRFVSDGISKVGEKTNFQNQYLKDVVVRPL